MISLFNKSLHNLLNNSFFRCILSIAFLIFIFQKSTTTTFAAPDFDINTIVDYSIDKAGITHVVQNISLVNKQSDVFVKQYTLSIASTKIKNVWVKDEVSDIDPDILLSDNSTTITIKFNKDTVGLGQKLEFKIGYDDLDINQVIGKVWEINIPKPKNLQELSSYKVLLSIPKIFAKPVQITPTPSKVTTNSQNTIYEFFKTDLLSRGITALFGNQQYFAFDLRYSLQNTSAITKTTTIALPPDTAYQTVIYNVISPKPLNIEIDKDGNWLAKYRLLSGEKKEIHATGTAILFLDPKYKNNYQQEDLSIYLKSQTPWKTDNQQIINLAKKLKNPENIYNFVVDNLNYNFDLLDKETKRLGGVNALANPNDATCMEFTDLFITLARAANIPAREINGYAYTSNPSLRPLSLKKDILHAWPQYFDYQKKNWVQVDPTWEKTTQGIDYFSRFDLNHFTFVIHGANPIKPLPAGFYKAESSETKDINITPKEIKPETKQEIKVIFLLSQEIIAGKKNKVNINISNIGNTSFPKQKISISSDVFDILSPAQINFGKIPPFASKNISLQIKSPFSFQVEKASITITINDVIYEQEFTIQPSYKQIPKILSALALGAAFAFFAYRTRNILLSFRKK